jgi:hypothetical protein
MRRVSAQHPWWRNEYSPPGAEFKPENSLSNGHLPKECYLIGNKLVFIPKADPFEEFGKCLIEVLPNNNALFSDYYVRGVVLSSENSDSVGKQSYFNKTRLSLPAPLYPDIPKESSILPPI